MAPKLLTDCPENLREAIDWLVQVKHCGGIPTVSDALARLFDNVSQDAEKSLPSLLDPDRPSARDVVSKLRTFQSTLPNNSENPNKNIIHNLCASADSLLGYRFPETYDGSGIVYGNASRLCDAILAFLYAVFSDVHGNQSYVAGRSVLHDVVVQLKPQLWRGHKGFCQAIPKVANGLRDYNAAVRASNEKVKKPIETVLNYVKPAGELRRGIHALQISETSTPFQDEQTVSTAVSLVERCKEVAKVFSKSLTAAKDAINDINSKLKKKLENARRSFFNHVDWLSRWSKKGQKKRLEQMVQKIKSRLRKLANAVKDKMKREVHTVVELLKKRVGDIKMKLEGITASLERYVKELGQWMDDAKKYIEDVKKHVDDIMKQLDGGNKKKIDEAAGEIDSELGKKVEELNQWIEKAEAAVMAAKKKADEVYGRLDKDGQHPISQGINQITAASNNVAQVDKGLQKVNTDLQKWREAAKIVLDIAVKRAEDVHEKLDPMGKDEKHPIGQKLNEIGEAKQEIDKANTALRKQVKLLRKWIQDAENIRQKAEEKAKEAYDKLQVHEKLSKNVKRIVEAKEKVAKVHNAVETQVKELGRWKAQAEKVISGAITNAQYVHDRLQSEVGPKIEEIERDNKEIGSASKRLEDELKSLTEWQITSGKVIKMAEDKCDKILEKVKTTKDGNIFTEASKLKDHGINLLKAASDAKQRVEENVTKALEAVKAMDSALKKDLFEVKKKIKEGIKDVIAKLKVSDLGEKVKVDLEKLRGNIEGLKAQVDGASGKSVVKGQLAELERSKSLLTEKTQAIKTAEQEIQTKFESQIKEPLEGKVKTVEKAINALGEKIGVNGMNDNQKDKLHKILEHVKKEVGNTLDGERPSEKKGLNGIAKGLVESYAGYFKNKFREIVKGWVSDSILKFNGLVWDKMGWDFQLKDDDFTEIAVGVRNKLTGEISKGEEAFNSGAQRADRKITEILTQVKQACEKFADALDNQATQFVRGKVTGIVDKVKEVSELKGKGGPHSLTAAEAVLCALSTASRQVSKEIHSILLDKSRVGKAANTSIAEELDRVIGVTQDLDGKLGQATQTSDDGTAQAVDTAIEGVKTEVDGIGNKFETHVKQPVVDAVSQLDAAVTEYDTKAKEQVKQAANKTIDEAAKVISENSKSNIDLRKKMPTFHEAHQKINNELEGDLRQKVEEHLPGSVTPSGEVNMEVLKFTNYSQYVKNSSLIDAIQTGKLPDAINSIKRDSLDALNKHIGGNAKNEKSTLATFNGPFEKIEKELDAIKKLVTYSGGNFIDGYKDDEKGIQTLLSELRKGLNKPVFDVFENGLNAITKTIEGLQRETFDPNSKKIGEAVKVIKTQVEELKQKLKGENNGNIDVINALTDLKDTGLPSGTWNGKDGLAKIETELKRYNDELGKQPGMIEQAINNINWEIFRIGFKLQDIFTDNDILDNLRKLGRKLGIGNIKDGNNLLKILTAISGLWAKQFSVIPAKINRASKNIEYELKVLRHVLQGETDYDVIGTLKELREVGLSKKDWRKYDNKIGLEAIEDYFKRNQNILSQQPAQIKSRIDQITNELDYIRDKLQGKQSGTADEKSVITNLKDMITMIGKDNNEGLDKIKTVIDDLKNFQLRQVTDKLVTLFGYIQNAAAYADWHVNQMATKHINGKLKGLQDGLNKLQLTDLAEAIRLCDDFLHKADDIERNTIAALLKHVDHEVDDAVNDLTKQARQHYVDSVREALELFAKKVNEDLEQLPNEMNRDRYVGYKGFMNTVEGDKGMNINMLKCLKSCELKLLSAAFAGFFGTVNEYVRQETQRLHDEQNKEKNPSLPPTEEPYTPKLHDVYDALIELLAYLRDNNDGAVKLAKLVERLTRALGNLVPSDFKHPSTPLLDTVARGLTKFTAAFHNTYISTYSGQRCKEKHAHKYAKVLLSVIPMTHKALSKLMLKCPGEWKALHISALTADDRDNSLGNYLTRCGYRVSSNESEQDGELNHTFTGAGIYELLTTPIEDVDIEVMVDGEQVRNGINFYHIESLLYNTLCHYFQVCHIPVPPEPRYPCTVRDMLSWFSGLQYTQVANKLPDHCKALLNRRCHDGDTPNRDDPVMAKCIGELPYAIAATCSNSTALLTAIQGNGHGFDLAAYPYSVDFSNNRARLHYPADPAELLDMLYQIVCRLCRMLYFLYSQCCRSTARVRGWRECTYGRQVQSHHWQCDTLGKGSTNSAITSTAATTITSIHGCPPTSPLQSFLSDCCHGLLPHTLTAADMAIECANCTANQPGQECLTPLGFWDLGFAASISGTGWDLAKRLGDMCRDADSCLFVLCRTLFLLCPTAPSSLADVFALYAQVLRKWDPHDRVNHRGGTYTDASDFTSHLNTDGIDGLFPLWTMLHGSYENNKLTTAIASLAGHDHKSHNALSSLFNDSTCKPPSNCAPYLQPLGLHARHTYPKKHAGLYITWIIYLAWQFWELVSDLLQALNNIDCTASGCATCPCQPGTHGGKDTWHCPSLVHCAGPLPTLYRYGFTYPNANLLVTDNRAIRCGDLNAQLKKALQSDHFIELFRQIDQLMWHIRMPFLYFLIALWYLVALYILHTFLYRLDIFHIRSHLLTTKASHLIDVKALLIPSRKMLSLYNASYFDDDPSELLDAT